MNTIAREDVEEWSKNKEFQNLLKKEVEVVVNYSKLNFRAKICQKIYLNRV